MSDITVHLATSSAEIKQSARAAADKSGGDIILVPVDFSGHSRAALVQAASFAGKMGASLVVLHVVHDPADMPDYYSKLVKKKRAARVQDVAAEAFEEFMLHVIEEHSGLTALDDAELLMVKGLPVTRIMEVVERVTPIMVVVGSQGRTGLKHLIIGSKASQIMQLCPVPVTLVKKKSIKS